MGINLSMSEDFQRRVMKTLAKHDPAVYKQDGEYYARYDEIVVEESKGDLIISARYMGMDVTTIKVPLRDVLIKGMRVSGLLGGIKYTM